MSVASCLPVVLTTVIRVTLPRSLSVASEWDFPDRLLSPVPASLSTYLSLEIAHLHFWVF